VPSCLLLVPLIVAHAAIVWSSHVQMGQRWREQQMTAAVLLLQLLLPALLTLCAVKADTSGPLKGEKDLNYLCRICICSVLSRCSWLFAAAMLDAHDVQAYTVLCHSCYWLAHAVALHTAAVGPCN
jgi:hypothetical protein